MIVLEPFRLFVWLGVLAWGFLLFNFALSFGFRRSTVRFTWVLGPLGALAFLLSRLYRIPYLARISLDVALTLGGLVCAAALTASLTRRGLGVLK